MWLKEHNPLYKDVEINFEFLEAWALEEDDIQVINEDDGSIPEVLKKQNENITLQHSVEEVYIETPQEDDVVNSISKGLVKSKKVWILMQDLQTRQSKDCLILPT